MASAAFDPTKRAAVRRKDRASYDRAQIFAILDEALVCHVGFSLAQQVFVIPTTFARVGDVLYVHGAAASRMLGAMKEGIDVCVEVTLLDGIVLARSAFHHSMNYRSAIVFGRARDVTEPDEKRRALDAIVDHAAPGRAREARPPTDKELARTRVIAVPIEEASAKSRSGGPVDDEEDLQLDVWAGEIPIRSVRLAGIRG